MDPDNPTAYSLQPIAYSIALLITLLLSPLAKASPALASNAVVSPAPDLTWHQRGELKHLSSLQGQPVLLLIAPSSKSWDLYRQLNALKGNYEHLANQHLICLAAFTEEEGPVLSNIPFITVDHGSAVGAAYGVTDHFALALISPDGNLDCFSTHVLAGQRIDDLIDASYVNQVKLRRP
ncbi:MAG: hypothetical protein WCO92_04770 [Verrucomicrobiota bacterium]